MKNLYYPTESWDILSPFKLNLKESFFKNLDKEITTNYENLNGIIILKEGHIAYENYYNSKGIDDRFNVASVTKSVLSALIGIALDRGSINSVKDKVIDYFPEFELSKNKVRDKVTIERLLTMSAPYSHKNMNQNLGKLIHSENWIKYSLEILGLGSNEGEFKYSDASAHLLSGILTRTIGLTAREFANENLFLPIGMNEIPYEKVESFKLKNMLYTQQKTWLEDKQGLTVGGWGLTLTLRDMAKFGLLYLRKGYWKGESIISENWIEESTKDYGNHYGYLWWLRDLGNISTYYAMGTGGNMILCIPSANLVIAIASEVTRHPIGNRWSLIENFILPHFLQ
ncbi:serine hydrolase domain-containing protein [Anaerosphaera multitolerans]|uniref:Class C beta-lactamase-related serine hydrolase n=1 Tax=Anaerosphaera multitolerans TaxID=2487351 RepID=A0A437S497_9FIRM|nr:serine hydrolase [Anaerosphaera multitolerans]RVU53833.1 class C beta-lactamase-related serine hydrolase [Anaerosphaera multitolerans]